jgi:hypothetical protein
MSKKPGNLALILGLWIFALLMAGLVTWLMILRGPAIVP